MSRHKITGSSSQAVPFSWEQLPGISKITHHVQMDEKPKHNSVQNSIHHRASKLRPPPSLSCRFLTPSHHQTRGRKGVTSRPELEDPFLAAFIECTKSVEEKEGPAMKVDRKAARINSWPRIERLRLGGFGLLSTSCKSSCGVREGNLVKLPKLPEREDDFDW